MHATSAIALTDLSLHLKRRYGMTPTYPRIWKAAVNAEIPVTKGPNGRWSVEAGDLPKIAEHFGINTKRATA